MKIRKQLITQAPECLTDPFSQAQNVIISVLFALVFLTAYTPFSDTSWFQLGTNSRFLGTVAFVGIGTFFLAISRTLMTFCVRKLRHFAMWAYLLWLFLEILVIAMFHTYLSYFLVKATSYSLGYIFGKSLLITFVALAVPYTIVDLMILLKDSRRKLTLTKSDAVESDNEALPEHTEIINLMDNNGNLKLSVKLDNLYYIKAEDNYINVEFTQALAKWVVEEAYSPEFGARPLKRFIQDRIETRLAHDIIAGQLRTDAKYMIDISPTKELEITKINRA